MANPSVVINSVTYASVPEVDIPKSGGGTAKFYYTGDADAAQSDILSGKSILGVSGSLQMPTISQNSTTKVLSIS